MKKLLLTAFALIAFTLGYSQSAYYNDYRSSITDVNWQTVAANLLLTPSQKSQLFALNNRYPNYDAWNRVYGNNPDRWRTDRYTEIERIMGADKYTKFKNQYYKGQNPVAVYNRNKNNHKRYENGKAQATPVRKAVVKPAAAKSQPQAAKSMKTYEAAKKKNDGSHLYIKGGAKANAGKGRGK